MCQSCCYATFRHAKSYYLLQVDPHYFGYDMLARKNDFRDKSVFVYLSVETRSLFSPDGLPSRLSFALRPQSMCVSLMSQLTLAACRRFGSCIASNIFIDHNVAEVKDKLDASIVKAGTSS
jgi:hypothetical protein